jgi:hypothetical protein
MYLGKWHHGLTQFLGQGWRTKHEKVQKQKDKSSFKKLASKWPSIIGHEFGSLNWVIR